jgi:hypothetical protein
MESVCAWKNFLVLATGKPGGLGAIVVYVVVFVHVLDSLDPEPAPNVPLPFSSRKFVLASAVRWPQILFANLYQLVSLSNRNRRSSPSTSKELLVTVL